MQGEINLIRVLLTFIGTADQSVKHAHFGKRKILFFDFSTEKQNPFLDQ